MIERENNRLASEAVVLQAAAAAVLSEEGHKSFANIVDRLREE